MGASEPLPSQELESPSRLKSKQLQYNSIQNQLYNQNNVTTFYLPSQFATLNLMGNEFSKSTPYFWKNIVIKKQLFRRISLEEPIIEEHISYNVELIFVLQTCDKGSLKPTLHQLHTLHAKLLLKQQKQGASISTIRSNTMGSNHNN